MGADPIWDDYQEALRDHLKRLARPDTQVDVRGVNVVAPMLDRSAYARYLNTAQVIENSYMAEREGYDAFCVGCTLDPGIAEIKDIVDIPVVFLFETCTHLAWNLARKFALLGFNKQGLRLHEQMLARYQLERCVVPCDTLMSISAKDLAAGIRSPQRILSAVKEAGRKAVDGGAGMFLSTCNILNMIFVTSGFRDIDGVPILDMAGSALKMTEAMVDLRRIGVTRSERPANSLRKEELLRIRKSYGMDK